MPTPNSSSGLQVRDLVKSFGHVTALKGVSLNIMQGEYFSLLGPSGCGKTTLLRLIAGLEVPDSGTISLDGNDITFQPAQQRPVHTVFQNYALFPHMTVRENVAFGLRMRRIDSQSINRKVDRFLELTRISELHSRMPSELSGGQKQRVALARALVNEPQIVLLDEPLAALDQKLRYDLQSELKALQQSLATTFIHVTHDQEEAMTLSDRVAIFNHGILEQCAPPKHLYCKPDSEYVATFLGSCNILRGRVLEVTAETGLIQTSIGNLIIPLFQFHKLPQLGTELTVGIRPEWILLGNSTDDDSTQPAQRFHRSTTLDGVIREYVFTGSEVRLKVDVNDAPLLVTQSSDARRLENLEKGGRVKISIPQDSILIFE